MTPLKKTIARAVAIKPANDKPHSPAVVYLQRDGLIVFRWKHGKKRYGISMSEVFERARRMGPLEGVFGGLLDEKTKPKAKKV